MGDLLTMSEEAEMVELNEGQEMLKQAVLRVLPFVEQLQQDTYLSTVTAIEDAVERHLLQAGWDSADDDQLEARIGLTMALRELKDNGTGDPLDAAVDCLDVLATLIGMKRQTPDH